MNLLNFPLSSPRGSIRTATVAGAILAFVALSTFAYASDLSGLITPSGAPRARPSAASAPTPPVNSASATLASTSTPSSLAPLQASTPQTNVAPPTVVQSENAEVDALTRETLVLEARLKNETLKRDIRKVQRDSGSSTNAPGMPPADALPSSIATGAPVAPLKVASDWVLIGTGAYDGRQIATIAVNGTARDVGVGDTIDGWTVKSILARRVTLGRGRATKTVSS
ncbi:type IV pilus biogenesis protein PilP [Burkholderia cepacia]|uniref:type IV pilus biogenesis protein PilP n=1 Tax=Burkholderia cepacia TaxID=292 RepID=UPI002AB6947E|nr:type IV pilus biogenesis protein PilP [Burkholderia cepacia]